MDEDRLRTETVYKGCTRPAMLFGVPITAFVLCVGGSAMLLFVLLSPPWALLSGLVWYVMRLMCKEDDQRFTQLGVSFLTKMRNPNSKIWGGSTFQPVQYREKKKK